MMKLKSIQDPREMRRSPEQHKPVKKLMTSPDDIESARTPALRHFGRVEQRARNVKDALETEVAPPHAAVRLLESKGLDGVDHGHEACETEADE